MARYTMQMDMTLDGTTFPGTPLEVDIPESLVAQADGPVVYTQTVAEWGFPGMTRTQANAATFGVRFYRGPSSDDIYGRVNDIEAVQFGYEGDTVGTLPITAMCQQRYIPGVSTKGGPSGQRRG